jgi:hypothetical protein
VLQGVEDDPRQCCGVVGGRAVPVVEKRRR